MKKILFFLGFVILLLLAWVNVTTNKVSTNIDKINVGIIAPMSGDSADYGKKCQKSAYIAQKLYDEKSNLIFEDTQASPTKGVSAVQKLIKKDNVQAIIGGILSSVTIPTGQISQKNKIVQIATTSSSPKITELGDFVYRVWPSDKYEGTVMANEAIHKYKKIAILYMNNDYGLGISKIFKETFEKLGGIVEVQDAYLKDENNFKKYILKLHKNNIPAVYIAGYYKDTALIVKQAYEIGYKPQFYGTTAIEDEKFIEIGQQSVEGFIYPIASSFDPDLNEVSKSFYSSFKETYSYDPGWVESHCFDASKIIFDAINKGSATTSKEIKKYIDEQKSFEGATGRIIFDKNGDVQSDMSIKIVKNSKFIQN